MINVFFFYLALFIVIEYFYLKFAQKKGIIDRLNERSSHTTIPIRGAGIIFPLAFIIPVCISQEWLTNFPVLVGLMLISLISFIDDIKSVLVKWRMLFHFTSVSLVMWQIEIDDIHFLYIGLSFILMVGVINAYNFMDGINGITALYSLTAIGTIFYINQNLYSIISANVFISLIASLLIFSFLNVRKVTKCFSGDVGSISMAFILTFLILRLIIISGNYIWVLLLAIYGIDTVATIFIRFLRKEHLLEAHRSHFYQYLANEKKIPHVMVSVIYAGIQLSMNLVLLTQKSLISLSVFLFLVITYIIARLILEGPKRLFVKY